MFYYQAWPVYLAIIWVTHSHLFCHVHSSRPRQCKAEDQRPLPHRLLHCGWRRWIALWSVRGRDLLVGGFGTCTKFWGQVHFEESYIADICFSIFLIKFVYLDDDDAARIANCGTADNLRSAESRVVANIAEATINCTIDLIEINSSCILCSIFYSFHCYCFDFGDVYFFAEFRNCARFTNLIFVWVFTIYLLYYWNESSNET